MRWIYETNIKNRLNGLYCLIFEGSKHKNIFKSLNQLIVKFFTFLHIYCFSIYKYTTLLLYLIWLFMIFMYLCKNEWNKHWKYYSSKLRPYVRRPRERWLNLKDKKIWVVHCVWNCRVFSSFWFLFHPLILKNDGMRAFPMWHVSTIKNGENRISSCWTPPVYWSKLDVNQ